MFPTDWEFGTHDNDMVMEDGSLSHYSNAQEPNSCFVLESWRSDQDPSLGSTALKEEDDEDDMMMMMDNFNSNDEAIILDLPSIPPAGRLSIEVALEDTLSTDHDDDNESFFTTNSDGNNSEFTPTSVTSFLPIEQRYQASLDKLAESMKRSQETRKSLRIKTAETLSYTRWSSISGTLSSIEKSTQQLQEYLKDKPAITPTNKALIL